jgi:hypothetical protein
MTLPPDIDPPLLDEVILALQDEAGAGPAAAPPLVRTQLLEDAPAVEILTLSDLLDVAPALPAAAQGDGADYLDLTFAARQPDASVDGGFTEVVAAGSILYAGVTSIDEPTGP